jgi:hypothetical protein
MANFTATIPAAQMDAINAELDALGFGPRNFSVPLKTSGTAPTHAGMHCWDIPDFRAALDGLQATYPALKITEGSGRPNLEEHIAAEALSKWEQPEGAHDPYLKGERTTVGGKTWESLIDYNVWPPGVSGWREIVAEGNPAWVQPTGAHDAYAIGDKVSFKGANYESLIAANVWSPTAYPAGWRKL